MTALVLLKISTLILILTVASFFDLTQRIIRNSLTYGLILLGITFSLFPSPGNGMHLSGSTIESVTGSAVAFSMMLLIYAFTNSGAGDVKLSAGIGAFLGVKGGLLVICFTYILAGCFAACLVTYRFGIGYSIRSFLRAVKLWNRPESASIEQASTELISKGLPLAPFFLLGTILVVFDLVS